MKTKNECGFPVGIGYRHEIDYEIQTNLAHIDILEFIGDALFEEEALQNAVRLANEVPCVCHFLDLSLGTLEPLRESYVAKMARVIDSINPAWISDHLAVTNAGGVWLNALSPCAFDDQVVDVISSKLRDLRRELKVDVIVENPTYYFSIAGGDMDEITFIQEILKRADCGMLLDLNNVVVNAYNHGFDPFEFTSLIPADRIVQVHIAGHNRNGGHVVDTHGHAVSASVFELLDFVCARSRGFSIILERDRNFPDFRELLKELERARASTTNANKSGEH